MSAVDIGSRTCPFCPNTMPSDATMCQSCGKFSKPPLAVGKAVSVLDRCNEAIARWEARHRDQIDSVVAKARHGVAIPAWLRIGAGAVLLVISAAFLAIWFRPYGGFAAGRAAIAFIVIGTALLLGQRLLKEPKRQEVSTVARAPWIVALGFANNLAVAQFLALLVIIVSAYRGEIDLAWRAGIVAVGLAVLLFGSRVRVAALTMGVISSLFLAGLWSLTDFGFVVAAAQRSRAMPELIIPIGALAWTVMAIAIVPQLQLLRIGSVGIGRFKGDFVTRLFGSDVPVSITTAILLVSLCGVVSEIPYLPGWIATATGS